MILKFKQLSFKILFFLVLFATTANVLNAQQRVKKVVLQAFWWDFYNNNYRFKWADYLAELAPRLKAAGVDAIWIPPNYKNDGPGSVGYGPFDQYDLGDKNQKGGSLDDTLRTRTGTKDELLRMMAVMHANGIDVIQDIVLNHTTGAGNRGGGGGRDYTAASIPYNDATNGFGGTNFYKNFRYICYATPHLDTSAADYWTRKGRWSKNIMNFYPNANNNSVNNSEINKTYFGPDMAYESNSIGLSTNIPTAGTVTIKGITKPYYNPTQPTNYMAQSAKDWIVWYKKQTGADGFRWDAVKHYGYDVQRDLTYALKYQSGFANGGNSMFNVGEYVGQPSEVDYYVSQLIKTGTPIESGVANEQLSGGFDFGLRAYASSGSIYSMVLGQGNFDMQSIPGAQQSTRYFDYPNGTRVYKTVPFVNSHDTYRPILTANGNFSQALGNAAGWNTSNELGGNGNHIDPREPRFAAANAVIAAVDGNPCFYIEDVFDYFSLNKRWTHIPSNADSLPIRKDVVNIMLCHQKLGFKDGDYGVPTAQTGINAPAYIAGSSGDHIVFERTGKALIGVSDAYSPVNNNSADQQVWVTCNTAWTPGTILYDYSGAHGISGTTIQSDRRVLIKTTPCGHNITGVYGHGYSIWAPYPNGTPTTVADLWNYIATYNQPRATTTQQEWEMADDLGDSHCASLGQGGQLPANSTNQRVAGKIFVQNGTNVAYYLTPSIDNTNLSISLWDLDGNKLSEASGNSTAASPISGSFSATYTGWITIKVRHAVATQAAQKVWANVTYTAPTVIDTRATANAATTRVSIWTGNKGTTDITDCGNWEEGKLPTSTLNMYVPAFSSPSPIFTVNTTVKNVVIDSTATVTINNGINLTAIGTSVNNNGTVTGIGTFVMNNTVSQSLTGKGSFYNLTTNNATGVIVTSSGITVTNLLNLANGIVDITNANLTVSSGNIVGANATNYIKTDNSASSVNRLKQNVGSTPVLFPVGNSNYTPITLTNTGTSAEIGVGNFESVLTNGNSGATLSSTKLVNKTWNITANSTTNFNVISQWNLVNEGVGFDRSAAAITKYNGTIWMPLNSPVAASGSNPYTLNGTNVSGNSLLSVISDPALLPLTLINFNGKLVDNKKVALNWTTENETNNKGFAVEKSLNGTEFSQIGFVNADALNVTQHHYSFNDTYSNKTSWYRLKQVDNNGKFTYSNIVKVSNSIKDMISLYPNPAKGFVKVEGSKISRIIISDMFGRTISQKDFDQVDNATLNIASLSAGVYNVSVKNANETVVLKLIVE